MTSISNITKIDNGYRLDKNGWYYVSIQGNPTERGIAHGILLANNIRESLHTLAYSLYENKGRPFEFFLRMSNDFFKPIVKKNYPEFYEEMIGIAKGVSSVKSNIQSPKSDKLSPSSQDAFSPSSIQTFSGEINVDHIILLNSTFSLDYLYGKLGVLLDERPELKVKYKDFYIEGEHSSSSVTTAEGGSTGRSKDRCSSFIAVGSYTKDGKIVCAHNTFDNFTSGQFDNIILNIKPEKGFEILLQTFPGGIFSGTDFFVSSSGIFGSETTIGGFIEYENKDPIYCRMRKAMQYGKNLTDYEKCLVENNSGDYACSWLFGDTNVNEIMRVELGLKFVNTERKKDGYFIGFNATYDPRIRNIECVNTGFNDIRRHQGARKVRLGDLMEENKGNIDIDIAKKIIADHYDVYLKKENPCSRTVCSHYELDDRAFMSQADRPLPYQPRGALDGKVIDRSLANKMSFIGRWGDSCGIAFDKDAFCNEQRQWKHLQPYLHNRPSQPWTLLTSNESNNDSNISSISVNDTLSQTVQKGGLEDSSSQIKEYIKLLTQDVTKPLTSSKKSLKTKKHLNKSHNHTIRRYL